MTGQDYALEVITEAESRTGLRLSDVAKQLLSLPVEEASQKPEGFDLDQAGASINRLIDTMTGPAFTSRADRDDPQLRDAQAVIRAIAMHFCNIPPFCDKTGR
jgi:hypothetical protein